MSLSSPGPSRESFPVQSVRGASSSRIIGEGEMAEQIRGFDWGRSALGPIETWSDTLVTTVNLLLASRHPMFLWWGPELIQFYNDGYRPSIRADKHPSAIGQCGKECWPEIWSIIGPQIDAVMNHGHSTWNTNQLVPINRNGKLEEVYWTYSYSPVRDKDGAVRGTLVVCTETTEQVLSERRLRALLSIAADALPEEELPESRALLNFAKTIVGRLDDNRADIPFAVLYLLSAGEVFLYESTPSPALIAAPEHWPLANVISSKIPVLVDRLPERLGDIVLEPWPEPVARAYVLPLPLTSSSIQAVLVFGISPRLPFDDRYRTFFEVIGSRIAGLLQSENHRLELAQAARRFGSLVEANPFGMVIGSLDGELTYVNPGFLETLGYSQAEVGSGLVRWDLLTPPEYAQEDARAVQQLRTSGRCDVYEKAYIAKDGRRVPILVGASTIAHSGSDPEIAAFITDLTPLKAAEEALRRANDELEKKVRERTSALEAEVSDRKRAELGLRELTGRLLTAQDEERRHMARELHDHAGQTLALLGMNLSALETKIKGQDPKIVGLAKESHALSDDLSREIRTLSYLLHPPLLDEVGLRSALRWYVDGFSERSKIKVDLELPPDLGRLPRELELVIFRVVQESLTNVHRHSGSSSARIFLASSQGAVEFEISDCGKGIPVEKRRELTSAKAGVGVRGMEERVRQFGGTLQISSSHEGTKVAVKLPLTSTAG
jgi:PAS domain S-box-containing protein